MSRGHRESGSILRESPNRSRYISHAIAAAVLILLAGVGAFAQSENVEVVVWDTGPSVQGDDGAIVTISGPASYEFYAGPDEDQSNPHPLYLPAGDYSFTVTAVWPEQPDIDGTSDRCRKNGRCRNSDIATFYIDFRAYETIPSAADDHETTEEDTPVIVPVLENDSASTRITLDGSEDTSVAFETETLRRTTGPDLCCGDLGYPESQTFDLSVEIADQQLDIVWVGTPSHGSAEANPDGTITYTPDDDYCGNDQFEYTIEDQNGSDTATVFIEIECISDPPVAENDHAVTDENSTINIDVTDNDSDPDGGIDASTVTITSNPQLAHIDVDPVTGVVTYTPDPGVCGSDSFTYRVEDFDGTPSNEATVTIEVVCNEFPVAGDDAASTNENTSIGINVLSNDADADGEIDPTSVTITSSPDLGDLSVHPSTGSITYTPEPGACGVDSFRYTVQDDDGAVSNEATVTVDVLCDDPPLAIDDLYTVAEGDTLEVDEPGILANDETNPEEPISAILVSDVSHGTLSLNADGSFVYVHDGSETSSDSFRYLATDGTDDSNGATVNLVITPTNDPPTAEDDEDETDEDTPVTIDALDNDDDPDGDALSVDWVSSPSNGEAVNNGSDVTYVPDPDFHGVDTFTYGVADGHGGTAEAVVTVTIRPINDPPIAQDDSDATDEDTSVTIDVLDNDTDPDGDPVEVESVTQANNGSVTSNGDDVTYTPDPEFHGNDSFTYTISDGNGGTSTATVHVTVAAINDPPIARDDEADTDEDTPISIDVLRNDDDIDGDLLEVEAVDQPSNGSVTNNGDDVTYTPDPDFHGSDSFTYTISDGNGGTDTATVNVTIHPVNDEPIAQDDSDATDEDTPVTIDVLDNDTDPDGDTLFVDAVTQPSNGSVINNGDDVTYTPDPDFHGSDSFTYTISDANEGEATASVDVTVIPVNDEPEAEDDSDSTDEDVPVTIDVLANDTDPDGDSLSVDAVTQPSNGSVTNNGDDVTYTPDPDFHGSDSFTYTISDANGGTDTATVTVTILPVNDAPIAQDDSDATDEDTPVTIDVLANDSDPDGDDLFVDAVTLPSNGSVTNNGDDVTYTPDPDFHGVDSFTYTISDGNGGEATASVDVTVTPVNDEPEAEDDSDTTDEDVPVTIDVLANDTDPDGDSLSVDGVTQPSNGSVTNNGDDVTYTPDPGFHGSDSFTYTISDANGGTDTATVTVTILPVNDEPVAQDDSAATDEDTPVTIDVLANDSDPDGDPLTVQSVGLAANGSVTNNGDDVTYTPDPGFYGSDSFTYTISDGHGGADTATVAVTIGAVNDEPTAADDADSTDEDVSVTIDVLANDSDPDGDPLSVQSVGLAANGSVTNNGDDVTYTPDPGFHGSDSFTYTISDANGGTDTATVTVTILPVNDEPVAQDDSAATDEDTPVTIDVLANDSDPDGDALTVQSVGLATNGSVTNNGDDVTYTPDPGFYGSDSFTYTISDGNGGTDTATVTVTIGAVNDEPTAADDADSTDEDVSVTIDVLANDSDPDGDALTVQSIGLAANGSITNNGDDVTYTPDPGFHGSDSFTYTISDGNGGTDTATVTVTIHPVNDEPIAQDDSAATDEDTLVTIDILGNDSDPDGDPLTVQSAGLAANGSVTNNGDDVTYTPDPGFHGSDSFAYTISDGNGGTDTATVTVTIGAVNDEPTAADDADSTDEDVSVTIDVLDNDSDPDGDPLTVQSVGLAANGSVTNNGDDVTYTPDPGFHGSDSFTYTISDGNGGTDTATVAVTILPVNDEPIAQDDSAATDEDTSVTIDVLANDSDPDGDALFVDAVTQPSNGSATSNGDDVTYTPDPDFHGSDSFTYTISDGHGGTDTATVTVAVALVNEPPIAEDDSATTAEDSPVTIPIQENDSDPDGDPLTVESTTQPTHGAVAPSGASVIYTPDPGFYGTDSFTYTISDGHGGTDTATVTITIEPVNDPPEAQDDSSTTSEDTAVDIQVLVNDSDPDGDTLSVQAIAQPENGSVANNGDNVTYTPNSGFSGTDTFTYTVSDGKGETDTATVIVSVAARNNPPEAQDDSAVTDEGTLVTISVLANDSDPDGDFLLIESFAQPANGEVLNARTGISYIPDPGFQGVDTFTYSISDGNGGTSSATVTVAVASVNDPPVAQDDNAVTDEGLPVTILVLLNDSDPDDDEIAIESIAQPENGTVARSGVDVIYTPASGFNGVDTFTYTISDGRGGTDTATVFVAIAAVNNPPVAQDDSSTTEQGTAVTITVLDNDSDPDADPLSIVSTTQPDDGTVSIAGGGVSYVPNEGFVGTDTFSYTIVDSRGNTDTAIVTVGVAGEAGAGGATGGSGCEGRIIISEIAWAGTAADPRDEWIELQNLGTTPVDLEGWELRWRRTHPSTPDEQTWKVVELSGTLGPSIGRVCDQGALAVQPTIRFSQDRPGDLAWFLAGEILPKEPGFYLLERRHDESVGDERADLLYDTARTLNLELSDLGEVIMLVNDHGEIVDTANASNLGRDGWVAGSTATFGTMERIDPLAADTASNWHTNAGIITHGRDAKGNLLRATPAGANSPVFENLSASAGIEPATVRAGEILSIDFSLPRQDRRTTGWPWISVSRPGFVGTAGAGGAADLAGFSFSGRYESGDRYVLDIGTQNLPPGTYIFWVTYGQGKAVLVPVIVAR